MLRRLKRGGICFLESGALDSCERFVIPVCMVKLFCFSCLMALSVASAQDSILPPALDTAEMRTMTASVYGVQGALQRWSQADAGDIDAAKTCVNELAGHTSAFFKSYGVATQNNPLSDARDVVLSRFAEQAMADLRQTFTSNAPALTRLFTIAALKSACGAAGDDFKVVWQELRTQIAALRVN